MSQPNSPTLSPPPSPSRKRKRHEQETDIEVDLNAPEPSSKRAARKAKKKEQSIPTNSERNSSESKPNAAQLDESKSAQSQRSPYGIWIGNLSFATDKPGLRSFLNDNSINDDEITRIHMPRSKSAEKGALKSANKDFNKGYAYVDFTSSEALTKALELTESLVKGRRVLIKDAKSFEGRPKKLKDSPKVTSRHPPNKRIFVGNLSFDINEDDLLHHYSKCGDIEKVHMATFEDSGKCKGYGWITFKDVEAATAAVRGWTMVEVVDREHEAVDRSEIGKKQRKWWFKKLKGREIRAEFGEDVTSRYQKRFGKGRNRDRADEGSYSDLNGDNNPTAVESAQSVEPRSD